MEGRIIIAFSVQGKVFHNTKLKVECPHCKHQFRRTIKNCETPFTYDSRKTKLTYNEYAKENGITAKNAVHTGLDCPKCNEHFSLSI